MICLSRDMSVCCDVYCVLMCILCMWKFCFNCVISLHNFRLAIGKCYCTVRLFLYG